MKGAAAGLYFSQQLSNTLFTVIVSRGTLLLFNKNIDVSDIYSATSSLEATKKHHNAVHTQIEYIPNRVRKIVFKNTLFIYNHLNCAITALGAYGQYR